jgi:predicted transcriptional regulator
MSEILELEIRKKIHDVIAKNPGINLTRIAELLALSVPLADYHLRYLVRHGVITAEKEAGAHKRFYITGTIGSEEKKLLRLLRQDIPLQIVVYLLNNPHSKHKDILQHFQIAPSTLTYYLQKLLKHKIIDVKPSGNEKGYWVPNEQEIIRFLIRYKQSKALQRFKETWVDDFTLP